MKTLRVLMVEDSAQDAERILWELRRGGFEPQCTRVDSREKLLAALTGQAWDIILSDHDLPGFNALDALKMCQDHAVDTPFIIVSGVMELEAALVEMRAGVRDFIEKDDLRRLVVAVERELRQADIQREKLQAEASLRHSAGYEELIATISVRFINLATGEIDRGIQEGLQLLGEFEKVNHTYISLFRDDGATLDNTYEWSAQGINPVTPFNQGIALKDLPLFTRKISNEYRLPMARANEVSPENQQKSTAPHHGGQEPVSVPLICSNKLIGVLGLDCARSNRIWAEDSIQLLQILGTVFANAIMRKRVEEEKNKLEAQFRQSQKMEAIGQLAGGVAHEFNNLLQAILGYSSLAKDSLEASHPAQKELGEVANAVNRASILVRQLLAFSRREISRPEVLELNDLISGLVKTLGHILGERIELTIIPGRGLRMVRVDPGQIEQALLNLCLNSRDAMPQGGRITIKSSSVFLDSDFCRNNLWAQSGHYVALDVSDTGTGMSVETQKHLFEPFFTTKGIGKGTGLGLACVYGIVTKHGGMINCHSDLGHGATFRIYLPTVEEGVKTAKEALKEELYTGDQETVLVAEDDNSLRELAFVVLKNAGYRVLAARDGEEAIRLFEENAGHLDLALLDLIMPKKDGREVCQFIRARLPTLPVLFSTGYGHEHWGRELEIQQNMAVIYKPYSPRELLEKTRELLLRCSSS